MNRVITGVKDVDDYIFRILAELELKGKKFMYRIPSPYDENSRAFEGHRFTYDIIPKWNDKILEEFSFYSYDETQKFKDPILIPKEYYTLMIMRRYRYEVPPVFYPKIIQ